MTLLTEPTRIVLAKGYSLPDDADAVAYIAAVEAADGQALETATRMAINSFVKGCKADGIWPAIKASCILAGARTLDGALVPLVGTAPTNNNFVSGDYDRKTGLMGNGSTKYLNSNRAGNADPQGNRHWAVLPTAVSTAAGSSRLIECGAFNSAGANGLADNASNNVYTAYNSTNTGFAAGPRVANRLVGGSRSTSSEFSFARNGSVVTAISASTGVSGSNWLTHRAALTAPATEYTNARLAFYSIGESLDLALLDARVTTLINAFAAAIP